VPKGAWQLAKCLIVHSWVLPDASSIHSNRPAGCTDIYEKIVRLTICFVTHPFDFIAAEETIPKEATVGSSGKRGLARSTVQRVHGGWEHNLCARR
jgi:hypothetical protein